jgi:hypothetical protein
MCQASVLADSDFRKVFRIIETTRHVRFSNRPIGVKRFQTIRRRGVNVTRGHHDSQRRVTRL